MYLVHKSISVMYVYLVPNSACMHENMSCMYYGTHLCCETPSSDRVLLTTDLSAVSTLKQVETLY